MNNENREIENELRKLGYWNDLYSKNDYFGTGQTILANDARKLIEKHSLSNILELGCGQGRDYGSLVAVGIVVVVWIVVVV